MDGDILKVSVVGVSMQGKGHMADGTECQDYFKKYENDGIYAIVMSDGAGSKAKSFLGAKAVVEDVIEYLVDNFNTFQSVSDSEIERTLLEVGVKALKKQGEIISDFACTLLFFITDGEKYICGNIGDGRIFLCDNQPSLLLGGQSGEIVNETNFISDASALLYFKVIKGYFGNDTLFVLATDGIGNLLYDRLENRPCIAIDKIKHWTEKYNERQVEYILKENIIKVFRELTVDDVSIALVYKNMEGIRQGE